MLKSLAALLVLAAFLLFPAHAFAQATASIAGTVVDASGAVLPGVDCRGLEPCADREDAIGRDRRHRSIPHRTTARRRLHDDVHVDRASAPCVAKASSWRDRSQRPSTRRCELGSVEETITVTGDTPIVDIQSAQRQRVIDQELLVAIPTGRTPQVAAFLIPGVNLSNVDVGGTNIINTTGGSSFDSWRSRRRYASADRRNHHRQHRGHRLVGERAAEHGQHTGSFG